jgi:pilus assembly protein CpaE
MNDQRSTATATDHRSITEGRETMTSIAALQPEPALIRACTISRDVQNFDLLIEDMEAELGESWGDLTFNDATVFLTQPEASALEFIAIAVDDEDVSDISTITRLIQTAKDRNIRVVLIAEEVSPIALHQLLRLGADDFVPYPLPEGALHETIERLRKPAAVAAPPAPKDDDPEVATPGFQASGDRDATILPVHGLAGGVGATTFAVNLAWELASIEKKDGPRVCLLDLDFQTGSVATYLDLPRREAVYELLTETAAADSDAFLQSLVTFNERLYVLTAPPEMLPLDILTSDDINRILEMARSNFDYVVIDMPKTVVQWTETVLNASHVYFALIELDMRSAQNALRLIRALKAEDLPVEKLRFGLSRAPRFTDLSGKARVKRLAESLDITIELLLADGGRQVTQSNDHGLPMAEFAAKNPLRKEIRKLAQSLRDLEKTAAQKAGK